ncbi:MAG: hypothetical protein SGJ09_03960, partial [Phycisphaerae bacterium]|nr:hypothetical protein [Phycisphaerae bacterium]
MPRPHVRPHVYWLLAMAVFIAATARGDLLSSRYVADPISLNQLLVWLDDRVRPPLSDDELRNVETLHDAYLARMRGLLDGPINEAIPLVESMASNPWQHSQSDFDKYVREANGFAATITAADEELFAEIAASLNEEQRNSVQG